MAVFPLSKLANKYLTGLKGVEIGASHHNSFGLDTINVDRFPPSEDNVFTQSQIEISGDFSRVDVVCDGDNLPFVDNSFDFVLSSHVIEHFYDPIRTIEEWVRVARRYVFIVAPHVDRTFDKGKPVTPLEELIDRYENPLDEYPGDNHWSIWRTEDFVKLIEHMNLKVLEVLDVDDKVGNGFTVLIEL